MSNFVVTQNIVDGGGVADEEFYMNTERVSEIVQGLSSAATDYESKIESLTATIQKLNSYWSGDTYNHFKDYYQGYTNQLNDLKEALENFSKNLNEIVENTCTIISNVSSILEEGGN